jgi:hypothetical protein
MSLVATTKASQTGWLINNRNLFLTVVEFGESGVLVSAEGLLLAQNWPSSLCLLMCWRED